MQSSGVRQVSSCLSGGGGGLQGHACCSANEGGVCQFARHSVGVREDSRVARAVEIAIVRVVTGGVPKRKAGVFAGRVGVLQVRQMTQSIHKQRRRAERSLRFRDQVVRCHALVDERRLALHAGMVAIGGNEVDQRA